MGFNFSKPKFTGTSYFTSRKAINKGYLHIWNDHIIVHYRKNNLNNALDLDEMINRNLICGISYDKIDGYALITDDNYRLRTAQIQENVDILEYDKVDKIGIYFVVGSFDFNSQTMKVWFTLIDMNANQFFFQRKNTTAVSKGRGYELWSNGISKYVNKTLLNASKSWK